jgi:hypothetical protein
MGDQMTPFIATDAALAERPQMLVPQHNATQLEEMAVSTGAPWLYSALCQLWDLENNGRMIPGIGDLRVREETASKARLFLSLVSITDLPAPVVTAASGGSVSIIWSMGDREVKLACYPDGQAMVFKCEDDEIVEPMVVNFAEVLSVGDPLRWMVQLPR